MIGLIAHSEKPAAASVVASMIAELERHDMPYLLERTTAPLVGKSSALDESALATQCKLLVVMGGDGTILRVVQKLTSVLPPIFGINIGTLGFLTCLGAGEIKRAVECIRAQDYGVIIAGWASNSKYAFLGSMRSAAPLSPITTPTGLSWQRLQVRQLILFRLAVRFSCRTPDALW